MGTEILRPQDCFNQRLRFTPNPNPNRSSCRKQAFRQEHKRRSPPPSSPPKSEPLVSKKPTVADDGKLGKNLVLGQVKILKRGESVEFKNKTPNLKKSFSADLADLKKKNENLKKNSSGDLKSFSQRLGPNPEKLSTDLKLLKSRSGDVYAGSTFDMSPSPRALPLPKFSLRRETIAIAISTVDDSATKDLRRLLRIG